MTTLEEGVNFLFPTPITRARWGEADRWNQELCDLILARQERIQNVLPTKSETEDSLNRSDAESIRALINWVGRIAQKTIEAATGLSIGEAYQRQKTNKLKMYNRRDRTEIHHKIALGISNCWASVYQDGEFHAPHYHPMTALAAVYFVQSPSGLRFPDGCLAFVDPRPQVAYHSSEIVLGEEGADVLIEPQPGILAVFPGWLQHYVYPFRGNGQRITISFNLNYQLLEQPDMSKESSGAAEAEL
jgi:hypothetical protein